MVYNFLNIPYSSDTKEYHRAYYLIRKGHVEGLKYINPKKTLDYIKPSIKPYDEIFIPTIDKIGILKEDDFYIYYIDKVWSKFTQRYIKTYFIKKYNGLCCHLVIKPSKCKIYSLKHLLEKEIKNKKDEVLLI